MHKTLLLNESRNLYEFPLLRRVMGDTLRPGGLKVTAQALELCGFRHGAPLLDVGCGAGASLAFLGKQGFNLVGMDTSPALLAEAQRHAPVLLGDAQALPFASGSFQGVFCECVVSLLNDAEKFFSESGRVLEDGGWLVVSDIVRLDSTPILDPLIKRDEQNSSFARDFSPQKSCLDGAKSRQAMEQLFARSGFTMRHVLDHRRSLVELAAKMVWEFGSMNAFWKLWHQEAHPSQEGTCAGISCAKQFGYELFIGQKMSTSSSSPR